MEQSSQWQEQYGFEKSIDCGAVALRMFRETYLERNLMTSQDETLAKNYFLTDELPTIIRSGLYASGHIEDQRELHGDLVFELPAYYQDDSAESIMEKLTEQLESTVFHNSAEFEMRENKLHITTTSHPPITIGLSLNHDAPSSFDLHTTLDTTKPSSSLYDDVVYSSSLWAQCHSFLVNASDLPFTTKPVELLVGSSDELSLSDIELLIEQRLTYNFNKDFILLAGWSDDIDSGWLTKLEKNFDDSLRIEIADIVLKRKLHRSNTTDQAVTITRADITDVMREVQRNHHQSPDENSHRD